MNLDKLTVGKNPPEEINVAIEIPAGSSPVKYELARIQVRFWLTGFCITHALSGQLRV